ncbi:MAG: phosphate acyltransferase, partial [Oliverpabstia sp.]
MKDLIKVAVDAMGGDYAPVEPVKGAVEAVNAKEELFVYLVGQEEAVKKELEKYTYPKERVQIVPASQVI